MKTGLILEGGAHRAIYTAGVLDVFLENDIHFDGVIGVSAGAIHGGSFVSEQYGRNIAYTLKFAGDRRYMSFYSLLTTGNLVGEEFCYHELPEKYFPFDYQTFENSKTRFYVTCSNLITGKAEYIECDELRTKMAYLRASASMPFVSQITSIDGLKLLDGGICDSIPLQAFQSMGYDRCVVVQTRAAGYQKHKNKLSWLGHIIYRHYPEFVRAIENRHIMYNQELDYIEKQVSAHKAFSIRPSRNIPISHMEKNKKIIRNVYELGRADAQNALPDMQKFLHICE